MEATTCEWKCEELDILGTVSFNASLFFSLKFEARFSEDIYVWQSLFRELAIYFN